MVLRNIAIVLWIVMVALSCGKNSGSTIQVDQDSLTSTVGSGILVASNSAAAVNTSSDATILFDSQTEYDTGSFTHDTVATPDSITVLNTGLYKITYSISYQNNYNNRVTVRNWISADATELNNTQSYSYCRNTATRYCTNSVSTIVSLNANQVLTLDVDTATGATFGSGVDLDVIQNESWIMIEYLNL